MAPDGLTAKNPADHATNIAEDVVYLYEGRDIRHTGKGKVRPVESDPGSR